jgi:hypothetical protein
LSFAKSFGIIDISVKSIKGALAITQKSFTWFWYYPNCTRFDTAIVNYIMIF